MEFGDGVGGSGEVPWSSENVTKDDRSVTKDDRSAASFGRFGVSSGFDRSEFPDKNQFPYPLKSGVEHDRLGFQRLGLRAQFIPEYAKRQHEVTIYRLLTGRGETPVGDRKRTQP